VPRYPNQLRAGGGKGLVFEHRPDLHSVRQAAGKTRSKAVAWMNEDAKTAYGVYEGPAAGTGAEVGPVYSAGSNGPLAVPTGRVFVRLAEGNRAEEHRAQFTAAGFDIEQLLSYAPNAAWLRPREGGVAAALGGLEKLHSLAAVTHVEPQLLMERALRS